MSKKFALKFALPELDTRSVLQVVEENFQALGLKAYAIRMIYTGEHTLNRQEITKHFENTVNAVNASYCDINIHGFLLVYDSYFVHILEGSEDTVHRQLRFLFKREQDWIVRMEELQKEEEERFAEEEARKKAEREELRKKKGITEPEEVVEESPPPKKEWKMFRRLKILIVYHSIKTLLFDSWRAVYARPPSLVGKLNMHGPLPEHMEQLRICLDKISKLCAYAKADDNLCFEGVPVTDPKVEALPEVALLDFLLQSQYVMELRNVLHMHRRVDDYYYYFELVWPLANHFTPRHLYKLKVDDSFVEPLPVMPWEIVKKEETEEGETEKQSDSDSD